jgi:two-component system sensor histidine kinase AlgZ
MAFNQHITRTGATGGEIFFLPNFCAKENVLLVMLIAELLAISLAIAQPGAVLERIQYLALTSLFIQWLTLSVAALFCSARPWLAELGNPIGGFVCFLCVQALTLVFTGLTYGLALHTGLAVTLPTGWLLDLGVRNLVISATVTAVALRYFYLQHQWKLRLQAETEARISALQARIRPHFLFNSMNVIASLTRTDPEKAEQAVEDLAELFRASLTARDYLSLDEELALTRSYLRLEEQRLGKRLRVEWNLAAVGPGAKLPALTLQPLVENAIYHGVAARPEGGTVKVSVRNLGDEAEIEVRNPLPLSSSEAHHSGNGLAQENVRQRLTLAFSKANPLSIATQGGEYSVAFRIPAIGSTP